MKTAKELMEELFQPGAPETLESYRGYLDGCHREFMANVARKKFVMMPPGHEEREKTVLEMYHLLCHRALCYLKTADLVCTKCGDHSVYDDTVLPATISCNECGGIVLDQKDIDLVEERSKNLMGMVFGGLVPEGKAQ